jgi:hypothetical protein
MTGAEMLSRFPDLPQVNGKLNPKLEFIITPDDTLFHCVAGLWEAYE